MSRTGTDVGQQAVNLVALRIPVEGRTDGFLLSGDEAGFRNVCRVTRAMLAAARLRSTPAKMSALRPLGHMVLAYAVSGMRSWHLMLLNSLMLAGLLVGLSLLDDYYDWRDRGEENPIVELARATGRPRLWVSGLLGLCALCVVPWLEAVCRGAIPSITVGTTGLGALWVASYTLPPLRLKAHPGLKPWVAPVAAGLLFIQSYTLGHEPTIVMVALALWCLGLQLYAELVHLIDDWPTQGIPTALRRDQARRWLVHSQLLMALYAGLCIFRWPLAAASMLCSFMRAAVAHHATAAHIHRWRRLLWHPFWSPYDLLLYAMIGILKR